MSGRAKPTGPPFLGAPHGWGSSGSRGVIVAYQLARLSRPDVAALATATSLTDPETTGAIASARITRLDPCGLTRERPAPALITRVFGGRSPCSSTYIFAAHCEIDKSRQGPN